MSIYAIIFTLVLLCVQAYSQSQKEESKKIVLWKSILIALFWWISVPYYFFVKSDLKKGFRSIVNLINKPIA